jgi:hypothetical protein
MCDQLAMATATGHRPCNVRRSPSSRRVACPSRALLIGTRVVSGGVASTQNAHAADNGPRLLAEVQLCSAWQHTAALLYNDKTAGSGLLSSYSWLVHLFERYFLQAPTDRSLPPRGGPGLASVYVHIS